MVKYSLVLMAAVAVIFSSGCDDGECCGGEKASVAPLSSNVIPTAVIKSAGSTTVALRDCTAGQVFDFDGLDSTDREDGSYNTGDKYVWTVDGASVNADANGYLQDVACPVAGTTKRVCLKVVDSDNQTSANTACMTLGKSVTAPKATGLLDPIATLSATSTDDGYDLGCTEVRDQDSVDTDAVVNPFGTDSAIKEILWTVLYADGGEHISTQTDYNIEHSKPAGSCGKWIDGTRGNATVTVTPTDDENVSKAYTFVINAEDDTITAQ